MPDGVTHPLQPHGILSGGSSSDLFEQRSRSLNDVTPDQEQVVGDPIVYTLAKLQEEMNILNQRVNHLEVTRRLDQISLTAITSTNGLVMSPLKEHIYITLVQLHIDDSVSCQRICNNREDAFMRASGVAKVSVAGSNAPPDASLDINQNEAPLGNVSAPTTHRRRRMISPRTRKRRHCCRYLAQHASDPASAAQCVLRESMSEITNPEYESGYLPYPSTFDIAYLSAPPSDPPIFGLTTHDGRGESRTATDLPDGLVGV